MSTPSEGTDALQRWHCAGSPQLLPELSIFEPATSDLHGVDVVGSGGVNESETLQQGIWPWSPSLCKGNEHRAEPMGQEQCQGTWEREATSPPDKGIKAGRRIHPSFDN